LCDVSAGPNSAPWAQIVPPPPPPSGAPVAVSIRNTATLIAISACVTTGADRGERIVFTFVRSRAHSGQRIPTGVGVMQSGQIGRPQEEHETPVSREGCL
jgi:hypothetical protein